MKKILFLSCFFFFLMFQAHAQKIQFSDFTYKGAFRLPEGSGGSSWEYSGYAMTFYPGGDPAGPVDGYPGSIFAIGHDHHQYVSEISIPVPVISAAKDTSALNTAGTIQEFSEITGNMFGELEIPRAGLAYLPAQRGQSSGKLHFSWGQHFQDFDASHGWCELDLTNPSPAGPWYFGGYTNYVTNDFLFDIPQAWSDANTPDQMLVSGRFRDGPWSGYGPALFAYGPWNDGNPPVPGSTLTSITPLLLYGVQTPGEIEITLSDAMMMTGYKEPDEWSGGAWLTSGTKSGVLLVGTKATGNSWYGFSNGVVYPTGPDATEFPDVPPWPNDDRGWWSENINGLFILFDTDELASVAAGTLQTYEPQPYSSLNIDSYLFDPGFNLERGKRYLLGGACFDREHGILYVFERNADEDETSLIHVWTIGEKTAAPKVNLQGLSVSPTTPPRVAAPITVSANASSTAGETLYYKFYYCANYGTSAYNTTAWTTIQDYSTASSAQYQFNEAGSYVVVVRVVTDPANEPEALPIMGQVVTVGDTDPVYFTGFSSNISASPGVGEPVTYTVNASTAPGNDIYYRFYYCANYGTSSYETTPWTMAQDYSTSNTCQIIFPEKNDYVVVVRAVIDPASEPETLPIIGGTVNVR